VLSYRYKHLMTKNPEVDPDAVPPHVPSSREPVIVDPVVREAIVEKIRQGNYIRTAAAYAGISYNALMGALAKGRDGKDLLYYNFWNEVQQAEAEAEVNRLEQVSEHAKEDWRAGMEILARRWPERWAKREHHRHEVSGSVDHNLRNNFAARILADPVSRDLARRLLTRQQGEGEGEEVIEGEWSESEDRGT